MKHITKRGSCKLGGLLFSNLDGAFEFTDWITKGCPSGYVKVTPDIATLANIPIVDAEMINGVYFKCEVKPLVETQYKIFSYMMPKKSKKHRYTPIVYDYLTAADPRQLVYDLRLRR